MESTEEKLSLISQRGCIFGMFRLCLEGSDFLGMLRLCWNVLTFSERYDSKRTFLILKIYKEYKHLK